MTDIHIHILPGIDDGAADTVEALLMTEALFEQNITAAVCTPHFYPTQLALQDFIEKRNAAMECMSGSQIKLIPASETAFHEYLFHYPELSSLYIENTSYLLLELPFTKKWEDSLFQALERFIIYYDCTPIIAHIERYPAANQRSIKILVEMGCLLQLNTLSIMNKRTREQALRLIRKGWITVLGSDCHNMGKRPPVLLPALQIIRKRLGDKIYLQLMNQSDCIAAGQKI